jgi:hypothetical protein
MKQVILICGISLLVVSMAMPLAAANLKAGETVTLSQEINDDLYAAGGNIIIQEAVNFDALLAGGQILVKGPIGQDLLIGGGKITVDSEVGDDLRAGGGDITITGKVVDDVLLAGGSVNLTGNSSVGGDAVIAGGALVIDGLINGDLKAAGGEVVLNGTVNGKVDIEAETLIVNGAIIGQAKLVAENIKIENNATFNSDVIYWNEKAKLDFGNSLVGGQATYQSDLRSVKNYSGKGKNFLAGLFGAWLGISLIFAAVLLLILMQVYRKFFARAAEHLNQSPWSKVGIGILYLIVTPVIGIFLLISIIGLPLGLLIITLYLFSLFFAKILAAFVIAQWVSLRYRKHWKKPFLFLVSLIVYMAIKLLVLLPIIGWIIVLIAISAGFGALIKTKIEFYKKIER